MLNIKCIFWQAELDLISSENILKFKTPPFFTVIIRSLTILEGFALSVDPNFRLVSDKVNCFLMVLKLSSDIHRNTQLAGSRRLSLCFGAVDITRC